LWIHRLLQGLAGVSFNTSTGSNSGANSGKGTAILVIINRPPQILERLVMGVLGNGGLPAAVAQESMPN